MTLTPRQTEVLATYVATESRKKAAAVLGIAPSSVRNHLGDIYRRLGTNNVIGAAKAMGWLEVGE